MWVKHEWKMVEEREELVSEFRTPRRGGLSGVRQQTSWNVRDSEAR